MRDIEKTSYLNIANAPFLAELYEKYLENPSSVDASWQEFFAGLKDTAENVSKDWHGLEWARRHTHIIGTPPSDDANGDNTDVIPGCLAEASLPTTDDKALKQASIDSLNALILIRMYRVRGHLLADLDPLGITERRYHPELDPATYGFEPEDMDREIFINNAIPGIECANLSHIMDVLKKTYCGSIGVEYMHISDPSIKQWIAERIETIENRTDFTDLGKRAILERLTEAEGFEKFLHTKYVGTKRFGLDGGESLIPAIEQILKRSSQLGVKEVVIGMPHRGRLSMLCNVLNKPYYQVLAEFEGNYAEVEDLDFSGDVKYHLGASADRDFGDGPIHLSLSPNPSHLEAVNPVALGKVRSKQDLHKDEKRDSVMSILLHGDAAFAGQGIVPECFLLSELHGYKTGGTIHFIVNNQIGFTTNPEDSRSSEYCSDVAKMVQCPIFHVNGDNVEAVVHVARIAAEYRAEFQKDAVVDMYCYRRFGHNEGDEPAFTQPLMYKKIKEHASVRTKYAQKLADENQISEEASTQIEKDFRATLDSEYEKSQEKRNGEADWLHGEWEGIEEFSTEGEKPPTGASDEILKKVGAALAKEPENFALNSKIVRQLKAKQKMFETGEGFDWGTAEALAFGSLLMEGYPVRLSGQDCERGTFSHRHCVFTDQENQNRYISLQNLEGQPAQFEVRNSPLSEYAVLGFEYGYTQANPKALVMWEAQFGDFVNGAQVMIDQFISSAEAKWLRMSGLVMLLPHGFEGQGPEHSSARPERFLQLCAEDNMRVVNCSTPANFFHALRRQLKRNYRKPLIVFTPKSLLRHKLCISNLNEMTENTNFTYVYGEGDTLAPPEEIKRVVMCSGKVYYDLLQMRRELDIKNVAIVRLEQFHPFPDWVLQEELKKYPAAEIVWCQEEPENMGAWTFVDRKIEAVLTALDHQAKRPKYVGRPAAASPATGLAHRHAEEQKKLVDEALTV